MIAHPYAAAYLLMSEAAATIIAALIAFVGGIAAAYVAFVLPERKKRPALIADFLDAIAEPVTQIIAMFEKKEIPHQAGHELFTNIAYFEEGTHRRFVSDMARETLNRLKWLAQDAKDVDAYLYTGEQGEALRRDWITKAKGIVGELRGEAAKLRVKF